MELFRRHYRLALGRTVSFMHIFLRTSPILKPTLGYLPPLNTLAGIMLITAFTNAFSAPEPLQTFNGTPIRTAAVNESGTRHDHTHKECINAPTGRLFEQGAFVMRVVHVHDADDHSCTPRFENYQDFVPGIKEPSRACLVSYVKSKGGIVSIGKRGHVTCAMDYKLRPADEGVLPGQPISGGHDIASPVPSLPADIRLERDTRSFARVSVPLKALQFGIDESIQQSNGGLPLGFSIKIMSSGFTEYVNDSTTMNYFVDVDISGPVGARCSVWVPFAIPASSPDGLIVQDVGTQADCKTGSLAGQLANLPQQLSNATRKAITDGLGKRLSENNDTFEGWKKQDPEWAAMVMKSLVQGSYCNWRAEPGLCISIGWRRRAELNEFEQTMLAKVPSPEGAVDKVQVTAKLDRYEVEARQARRLEHNGIKFPSGGTQAAPEDGDMGIFGGLLCRSGSEDGCRLLQDARTADGRFWRSPRRVNEADTKDHASFSGDQLRGVLHYFTKVGHDPATQNQVKDHLRDFLRYLRSQPTHVPDATVQLITGYSSCPTRYPNFTCLLGGDDWYALKLLAKKHGLENELPPELAEIERSYGFDYEQMLWQSIVTNAGYRLHLIANTAWIMRSLGETDPRIEKTIMILNARQPENPFFAYLLHGSDKRVKRLADNKCLAPDAPRDGYVDWAWQRADAEDRWKLGMVWDCVFIYGLLARDPMPN